MITVNLYHWENKNLHYYDYYYYFKKINAHRIVLATCSKYFEQILQEFKQNCNSPIIVLEGLLATNLESIMDDIYKGEVQILQQDLDSFLKIAKRLQLNRLDESRFTGHS